MIDFTQSILLDAIEHKLLDGFMFEHEGQAAVMDYSQGEPGIRPAVATDADTDVAFFGIAVGQVMTDFDAPMIQKIVGAASVQLKKAPIAGQLAVLDDTGAHLTVVAAGTAPAAGEVSVDGDVLTMNAAEVGKKFTVVMRYTLTARESAARQGHNPPGNAGPQQNGRMGVVRAGRLATDQWDASADWSKAGLAGNEVRVGANGKFTVGGSGVVVPVQVVTKRPGIDGEFLVINFRA